MKWIDYKKEKPPEDTTIVGHWDDCNYPVTVFYNLKNEYNGKLLHWAYLPDFPTSFDKEYMEPEVSDNQTS